jgi:hypothetical protein
MTRAVLKLPLFFSSCSFTIIWSQIIIFIFYLMQEILYLKEEKASTKVRTFTMPSTEKTTVDSCNANITWIQIHDSQKISSIQFPVEELDRVCLQTIDFNAIEKISKHSALVRTLTQETKRKINARSLNPLNFDLAFKTAKRKGVIFQYLSETKIMISHLGYVVLKNNKHL